MSEIEIEPLPLIKPDTKMDKETHKSLLSQVSEESQVIMHCSFKGSESGSLLRVWDTVCLYAKDSNHRSELVMADSIVMAPEWMDVFSNETVHFTLIFTGLPKSCKCFDLIENAPTNRGFLVKNIPRNNSDVYSVDVTRARY